MSSGGRYAVPEEFLADTSRLAIYDVPRMIRHIRERGNGFVTTAATTQDNRQEQV